jgi:hypothetical protein
MQPRHRLTVDAYLAATPELDVRHEWVNGEAYARAGGTPLHAAVAMYPVTGRVGQQRVHR